jgi:hypothetical protein
MVLTSGIVSLADGTQMSRLVVRSFMLHEMTLVDGAKVAILALVKLPGMTAHVGIQVSCMHHKLQSNAWSNFMCSSSNSMYHEHINFLF